MNGLLHERGAVAESPGKHLVQPRRRVRILIFGNSGSGKSTLARRFALQYKLALLDLDEVVWSRTEFAQFKPEPEIVRELELFLTVNPAWVVEGCYGSWMKHLEQHCTEMVFLNPAEELCLRNCRTRPWEPAKYSTKEEQDAELPLLLEWVRGYYTRSDDMSLTAHRRLFDAFNGTKREITNTEMPGG